MKNYRFLALPMAMLLIGSAFTGCGSKNDSSAGDSTSTSDTDTSREDGGLMSDVEDGVRDIVTDAGDAVRDAGDAAGDAVKDAGDAAGDLLDIRIFGGFHDQNAHGIIAHSYPSPFRGGCDCSRQCL